MARQGGIAGEGRGAAKKVLRDAMRAGRAGRRCEAPGQKEEETEHRGHCCQRTAKLMHTTKKD